MDIGSQGMPAQRFNRGHSVFDGSADKKAHHQYDFKHAQRYPQAQQNIYEARFPFNAACRLAAGG